jgi:hypothetical protein
VLDGLQTLALASEEANARRGTAISLSEGILEKKASRLGRK